MKSMLVWTEKNMKMKQSAYDAETELGHGNENGNENENGSKDEQNLKIKQEVKTKAKKTMQPQQRRQRKGSRNKIRGKTQPKVTAVKQHAKTKFKSEIEK